MLPIWHNSLYHFIIGSKGEMSNPQKTGKLVSQRNPKRRDIFRTMKTSLLLAFLMVVTLNLVLAEGDDGYLYGGPSGDQLQEISAVNRPRKHRLNPRVYPQPLSQACGDEDAESHAAAVATYHASRPQPRRISHHKEVVVDSSFFEPSAERIEELRRFALDQL